MEISSSFTFRAATAEDTGALGALHRRAILKGGAGFYSQADCESWAAGLDRAFYEQALNEATLFEVAVDAAGVIAALGATRLDEIWLLYTDPPRMGCGIGGALLARLEENIAMQGHRVMMLRSSRNAEAFYAARGWRSVEAFGHTTRGGRVLPAVRMEKPVAERG